MLEGIGTPAAIAAAGEFRAEREKAAERAAANLGALLDEAVAVVLRYVHFTSIEQAHAVVLWCASTHRYDDFDIFPRLAVRAATMRSGKTRVLHMCKGMAQNTWGPVVGPSAASLFRKVEKYRPTLLLDEADRLFSKRAEDTAGILEVLNAGHDRDEVVPRVVGVGTKQDVYDFSAFCPVAVAGIGVNWPDTLLDRSIVVTLEKRKKDEPIERYRRKHYAIPKDIGNRLAALMPDVVLPDIDDVELPDELDDRAQDNWFPLFAVAEAAGGEWPARVRRAAHVLGTAAAELQQEDEREEVQLLGDVAYIFDREDPSSGFMGSKDIVEHLVALEDRPWVDWPNGFTQNRLARLLRKLDIRPDNPFGSAKRGYHRTDIDKVWARLGPRR